MSDNKDLDRMLDENQTKFKAGAWKNYTDEELRWWIKLLRKRADNRSDEEKRNKDLKDANNYALMLSESVKYDETKTGVTPEDIKGHIFGLEPYRIFRDENKKVITIVFIKDGLFKEFILNEQGGQT